jgi:sensor histidine kinase YesM
MLTNHFPSTNGNQPFPPRENDTMQSMRPQVQPPQRFDNSNMPPPRRNDFPFFGEASHVIFLFFVVFFFSLSLKINHRLKTVQQEKKDAELSYLKSQINPHFLFNTLNLIYSLIIKKSQQAADAVVQLANMMRYVLYESDKNFVPLQDEINYINNYYALQQTRFGNSIHLDFAITGEVRPGKKIAPLILIPFVENAFKHGVNAEENSSIKIRIDINDNDLVLNAYNTKVHTAILNKSEGGVGIINTKNRLQLLYANNYELRIDDQEKDFSVYLKLHLYD